MIKVIAIALAFFSFPALGANPVSIANSETRAFHSENVGIDYKLYISLPASYSKSTQKYPVIYVLDGDYFFTVVHAIMAELADYNEIKEVIVVGITYPGVAEDRHGPIFELNRTRDYTPTHMATGGYGPEYQKVSGGADHFLDFIQKELIPFVERSYRVKEDDRALVGISYGGLATSYALLSRPTLFQKYLIVSPALGWDKRYMMGMEKKVNRSRSDLPARVFFSAGGLEKSEGADVAKDIAIFSSRIKAHHFPGFQDKVWVVPEESHHTVFFAAAVRGLKYLFENSTAN